jgi:hypothetical protein
MKKLFALLCIVCLLTGCASTGALNQTNAKLDENITRIDKNFVIIKNAIDAQAKAIAGIQPKKEPVSEKQEAPVTQAVTPK